ncbi:hypothetical protein GOP47_0023359 [Adiantum capillus-veneris]|uniref:Uncharacterized protein n=1 Tax=Adiantum capillus-veneris TaxID=13818 RepID=A0A9D4U5I7_ADICA|nr:hypothetical protein GOP47_0023359 [Adiantum capillus-veneris]
MMVSDFGRQSGFLKLVELKGRYLATLQLSAVNEQGEGRRRHCGHAWRDSRHLESACGEGAKKDSPTVGVEVVAASGGGVLARRAEGGTGQEGAISCQDRGPPRLQTGGAAGRWQTEAIGGGASDKGRPRVASEVRDPVYGLSQWWKA